MIADEVGVTGERVRQVASRLGIRSSRSLGSELRFQRARFKRLTRFNHETGCREWVGGLDDNGFGKFQGQKAHEFAYRMFHRSIPDDATVEQVCGNGVCVERSHLMLTNTT